MELDSTTSQTITEIDVFTLQDDYAYDIDPTPDLLFGIEGTTALNVAYWTGSAWQVLGSVTGNANVWMTFHFPAVTTTKIRVNITQTGTVGRLVAVEVYNPEAAAASYSYDLLDQLLVSNDPVAGLFTYSYDRAFNRKTKAGPAGVTTYGYDRAHQLLWYQDRGGYTTYAYDANGNTAAIVALLGHARTMIYDVL